jgi:hypothetical protein
MNMKGAFTVREERRLRMFKNTLLRRIFGPKTSGQRGERRRLHIKELYVLYSCSVIFG